MNTGKPRFPFDYISIALACVLALLFVIALFGTLSGFSTPPGLIVFTPHAGLGLEWLAVIIVGILFAVWAYIDVQMSKK